MGGGAWFVKGTLRPLYPRETDSVPIVQEAVWAPGSVWTGVENLASHRCACVQKISPPPGFDPRTVQSVASRNRLRYPAPRRRKLWTAFCAFTRLTVLPSTLWYSSGSYEYITCYTDNRNNVVTDYATTYLQVNSVNSEITIWEEI